MTMNAVVLVERQCRIREIRRKQSQSELKRKAEKASRRQNIWTQEELDAANAEAKYLMNFWNPV